MSVSYERNILPVFTRHPPKEHTDHNNRKTYDKDRFVSSEGENSALLQYETDENNSTCEKPQSTKNVLLLCHQITSTTSITLKNINRDEREHMITYGAPGALNISALAA